MEPTVEKSLTRVELLCREEDEQARLETLKYKSEKEDATIMVPFHSNRLMDYHKQKLFSGGYLFLQSIYYWHSLSFRVIKMNRNL